MVSRKEKMSFVCKKTYVDQLFSDFSIQTTRADLLGYLFGSCRFGLKSLQVYDSQTVWTVLDFWLPSAQPGCVSPWSKESEEMALPWEESVWSLPPFVQEPQGFLPVGCWPAWLVVDPSVARGLVISKSLWCPFPEERTALALVSCGLAFREHWL